MHTPRTSLVRWIATAALGTPLFAGGGSDGADGAGDGGTAWSLPAGFAPPVVSAAPARSRNR